MTIYNIITCTLVKENIRFQLMNTCSHVHVPLYKVLIQFICGQSEV